MNQLKKKKQSHINHLNHIKEIKVQREADLKRKKYRIIQKIENMIKKRNDIEEEKHRKMEEIIKEEKHKKKVVNRRLEMIKRDDNEFRNAVLSYQQELIWRALDKDNATNLKRSNAQ